MSTFSFASEMAAIARDRRTTSSDYNGITIGDEVRLSLVKESHEASSCSATSQEEFEDAVEIQKPYEQLSSVSFPS